MLPPSSSSFLQPLTDRDNEHNWHNVADEHAQQGRGLGRDLSGKLNIGPQQTADQLVIRENTGLVECVLALVVLGLKGNFLILLVVGDGLHLAVIHHRDELVVANFGACRCSKLGNSSQLSIISTSSMTA